MLDLQPECELGAMKNCGRWSETVAVIFPETESGTKIWENMLPISVLELLVTLVG